MTIIPRVGNYAKEKNRVHTPTTRMERGGFIFKDIAPTIDAGIWKWHTLIVETYEKDERNAEQVYEPNKKYK